MHSNEILNNLIQFIEHEKLAKAARYLQESLVKFTIEKRVEFFEACIILPSETQNNNQNPTQSKESNFLNYLLEKQAYGLFCIVLESIFKETTNNTPNPDYSLPIATIRNLADYIYSHPQYTVILPHLISHIESQVPEPLNDMLDALIEGKHPNIEASLLLLKNGFNVKHKIIQIKNNTFNFLEILDTTLKLSKPTPAFKAFATIVIELNQTEKNTEALFSALSKTALQPYLKACLDVILYCEPEYFFESLTQNLLTQTIQKLKTSPVLTHRLIKQLQTSLDDFISATENALNMQVVETKNAYQKLIFQARGFKLQLQLTLIAFSDYVFSHTETFNHFEKSFFATLYALCNVTGHWSEKSKTLLTQANLETCPEYADCSPSKFITQFLTCLPSDFNPDFSKLSEWFKLVCDKSVKLNTLLRPNVEEKPTENNNINNTQSNETPENSTFIIIPQDESAYALTLLNEIKTFQDGETNEKTNNALEKLKKADLNAFTPITGTDKSESERWFLVELMMLTQTGITEYLPYLNFELAEVDFKNILSVLFGLETPEVCLSFVLTEIILKSFEQEVEYHTEKIYPYIHESNWCWRKIKTLDNVFPNEIDFEFKDKENINALEAICKENPQDEDAVLFIIQLLEAGFEFKQNPESMNEIFPELLNFLESNSTMKSNGLFNRLCDLLAKHYILPLQNKNLKTFDTLLKGWLSNNLWKPWLLRILLSPDSPAETSLQIQDSDHYTAMSYLTSQYRTALQFGHKMLENLTLKLLEIQLDSKTIPVEKTMQSILLICTKLLETPDTLISLIEKLKMYKTLNWNAKLTLGDQNQSIKMHLMDYLLISLTNEIKNLESFGQENKQKILKQIALIESCQTLGAEENSIETEIECSTILNQISEKLQYAEGHEALTMASIRAYVYLLTHLPGAIRSATLTHCIETDLFNPENLLSFTQTPVTQETTTLALYNMFTIALLQRLERNHINLLCEKLLEDPKKLAVILLYIPANTLNLTDLSPNFQSKLTNPNYQENMRTGIKAYCKQFELQFDDAPPQQKLKTLFDYNLIQTTRGDTILGLAFKEGVLENKTPLAFMKTALTKKDNTWSMQRMEHYAEKYCQANLFYPLKDNKTSLQEKAKIHNKALAKILRI